MKKLPVDISRKLLKATFKMPEGSGFDVSIDDVAEMSGVPRATLYYYFSGKDDLVQFYLNEMMDMTSAAIEKAAAMEGSVTQRLEAIMGAVLGAFAAYPRMCLEMPTAFKASDDHAEFLRNIDRTVMTPLREALSDGARSGKIVVKDLDTATFVIMGALHQVAVMRLILTGSLDADEAAELVIPQLLDGLLPR
ncbi:MAG: TetR/AcrR family transcriptional regulator [Acidimicrobiia bacterium]